MNRLPRLNSEYKKKSDFSSYLNLFKFVSRNQKYQGYNVVSTTVGICIFTLNLKNGEAKIGKLANEGLDQTAQIIVTCCGAIYLRCDWF